jgi:4-diphosphocytidyl-2-C-methyl-D-erythritol kinase
MKPAPGADSPAALGAARVVHALAPAKINPWLEVLGRRPDGYHDLQTWMLSIELCDRVEARPRADGEIRLALGGPCASADIPCDASNLAWRAAEKALEVVRRAGPASPALGGAAPGVELHLEKHIPSQAGLGGASSDAAATWLAVLAAHGIETSESIAESALAALGSDCVFFAKAARTGLGWCEGRGERVTVGARVSAPWVVALLTPDVRCPTASVYAALRKPLRLPARRNSLPAAWFEMPAAAVRGHFFNELEAVALDAIPALVPWRNALDACGGEHFRLSGSGSSFYGLFDTRDEAEVLLERIVGAARARGLTARGRWITRPAGFGARLATGELSKDL